MPELSELLRQSMRMWASGVAVVTSRFDGSQHGMTVNSFVSISLDPPLVSVTLANNTRTLKMVHESGLFAVTILAANQADLSDRFSGKIKEEGDRMAGLDTFTLVSGAPLLSGGLSFVDCQVEHTYGMPTSTLLIGRVLAAARSELDDPLIYFNRSFHKLEL